MNVDVFFLLFVYLFFINVFVKESNKRTKTILLCLGPVLIQSLRSPTCGTDVWGNGHGYYYGFTRISEIPLNSILNTQIYNYEQGYVVYNKLLSFVSDNPQIYLALTSIIIFTLIGYIYGRYSENIFLSITVFVSFGLYIFSFSGLRQAIAFSITLFSFKYIVERKLIRFLVFVLLAFTIHSSAIIFLFVWGLWNIRLTNKLAIILILITFSLIPLYGAIFSFIVPIFFREKYLIYMNGGTALNLMFVYLIIFVSPIFLKTNDFRICSNDYNNNLKFKIENCIRWMAYFSFLFQSLGFIGGDSITRIAFYFSVFLPLYIPLVYKRSKMRLLFDCLVCFLCIVFFYYDSCKELYGIVPYKFFWSII